MTMKVMSDDDDDGDGDGVDGDDDDDGEYDDLEDVVVFQARRVLKAAHKGSPGEVTARTMMAERGLLHMLGPTL